MKRGEAAEPSGPSLRLVLGSITVLVIVLGVAAYWRYSVSENHFAKVLKHMDQAGTALDAEGCVSEVLDWHNTCEANKALCDSAVPRVMTHCLAGADRSSDCAAVDPSVSAKGQWLIERCVERGTPCKTRKKCACADAYRTIDSFCRHGQEGVPL